MVVLAQLGVVTSAGVLSGNGLRRSLTAGLALGQIGEFAFIIAQIGIAAGVVRASLQPIVVTVALLTAFTTPIFLAKAPRVVHLVDHLLPDRFLRLLGVYEGWHERRRDAETQRGPVRQAVKVIVFDAVVLVSVEAMGLLMIPRALPFFIEHTGLDDGAARVVLVLGLLLVSGPFAIGIVRNTRALAHLLVSSMEREDSGSPLAAAAVRVILHIAVILTVGLPASAVLRPIGGGVVGLGIVGVLVAVALVLLWRRAGEAEGELRSAAEGIAAALAQPPASTRDTSLVGVSVIPGFDVLARVAILEGWHAAGRTLAELDVRARTGANVVAIHHAAGDAVLPTGHERLEPGDTLAVAADAGALEATRALLERGPALREVPSGADLDEDEDEADDDLPESA